MHVPAEEWPLARPETPSDAPETVPPLSRVVPFRVDVLAFFSSILAAAFRLYDVNWDQGTHIHPDERYLTMLGSDVRLPHSLLQYFDPATSPLNPYNYANYKAMVYGMLPISLNKLFAGLLHSDDFGMFTLQGRVLSALSDVGTLVFVYLIARLLVSKGMLRPRVAYLTAAFYAIAVLPIQLSHFFAVDTFLTFFAWGSVYFALRYALGTGWMSLVLAGLFLGFSLACKVSGIYIALLVSYLVIVRAAPVTGADPVAFGRWIAGSWRNWRRLEGAVEDALFAFLVLGAVAYMGLRLGAPYYFQSFNPLDPRLSSTFLANLQSLKAFDSPAAWYPPGVQWVHKPPLTFALVNLAVFGLGVPYFLAAVGGAYVVCSRYLRTPLFPILLWSLLLFLYQSTQYVKTMRYFVLLYPALALFAAMGLSSLQEVVPAYWKPVLVASLVIWPMAFMSIYMHDHSRVTASAWMYKNLPNGARLIFESWDDPLPLQIANPSGKTLPGQAMPSFDQDTPDKWRTINKLLRHSDYLVLSSNRGWGSIPTDADQYPRMTRFYADLFAGKTAYREVARFTSYPSLRYLGIPVDFPDQWAEEAFTVYDHPEVLIFKHVR